MKRTMRTRAVVTAMAVTMLSAFGITGTAAAGPAPEAPTKNIVETAAADGRFDTLVSLVQQAGLAETLASEGKFTVFAPTDAAFAKVPKKTLDALAADPEQLKAVLLYHVVQGELRAKKVMKKTSIKTLNGASVKVKVTKGVVKVNNARVQQANVLTTNGVVHVINRVLIP